jgi:hypothetical protein
MAGANPAMIIRIAANLAEFKANLVEGKNQIETTTAAMGKLASSFSGDKLIQAAHNVTAAVNAIGGASKLTESEMARVNATVQKAIEKYEALGREAPAAMRQLATDTTKTNSAWESFSGGLSKANSLLGLFGAGLSIGAVVSFGKGLLDTADQLVRVADRTGLTTTEVQKLQYIAGQSGNSLDELTGAVGKLQKNLVTGDASAVAGVKALGLNFEALRAATPYEQMEQIATAIAKVPDPAQRSALAVELFGKSGQAILPTLISDFAGLGNAAPLMKDKTVRALDDAGDTFARFSSQVKVWAAESYNFAGNLFDKLVAWSYKAVGSILTATASVLEMASKIPGASSALSALGVDVAGIRQQATWFNDAAKATTERLNTVEVATRNTSKVTSDLDDAMLKATKAVRSHGDSADKAAKAEEEFRNAFDKHTEAARKNEAGLAGLHVTLGHLDTRELEIVKSTLAAADAFEKLVAKVNDVEKAAWVANFGFKGMTEGLEHLGTRSTELDDVKIKIDEAAKATAHWDEVTRGIAGLLSQVAGIDLGPIVGQIDAVLKGVTGKGIGESLSGLQIKSKGGQLAMAGVSMGVDMLAAATEDPETKKGQVANMAAKGAQLGTKILPGWGTAVGAGVGAIVGLLKVSPVEIKAREEYASWQDTIIAQFDKMATKQQKLEAGGEDWKKVNILVRDAYAEIGLTGDQAMADLGKALDATHGSSKAVDQALASITDHLAAQQQLTANVTSAMNDLSGAVSAAGVGMPAALQPMIDQLLSMPGITGGAKDALLALTGETKPDFAKLEGLAHGYGIELGNLGPTFQQAHVTTESGKIIDDFEKLKAAGADVNGLIGGMGDEISGVVNESIKFGSTVPENMRPMIEKLIESGGLLDEHGHKIDDISQIKFGEPIKTGVDKIVEAIERLTKIFEGLPGAAQTASSGVAGALAAIPKDQTINIRYHIPDLPQNVEVSGGASGGLVTPGGIIHAARGVVVPFLPRGTDTVPAMLTPGERVLSVAQNRDYEAGGRGGSTGTVERHLAEQTRLLRSLPRTLAIAVSDAVTYRRPA